MARRNMRVSTEDNPPDGEAWIWGNNRGGGGAPLKDSTGHAVANLRQVLRGSVDVDYSPSPTKKDRRKDFDYDGRDVDKDRDRYRQSYDDREGDRYRRRDEDRDFGRERNGGTLRDRDQPRRRAYSPDDRDEPRSRRGIPGLDDQPKGRNSELPPAGSPKKFLGALRDMNSGMGTAERELKIRKEQEYQQALREQIEEKKRKKEEEQRELDAIKRKELEEFYRSQGKEPPRAAFDSRSNIRDRGTRGDDGGYDNGKAGKGSLSRLAVDDDRRRKDDGVGKDAGPRRSYSQSSYDDDDGRRGAAYRDRRFGDDDRDRESLRGKVRDSVRDSRDRDRNRDRDMDEGGNRRRYAAGGDDDYDDDDGRGRNRGRVRDRDDRDDDRDRDDWVPLQKYDELQNLCDQLMRQQEELQQEIKHQAGLIKGLQQGGNGAKGGGPTPGQFRSKSVQQSRGGAAAGRGVAGRGLAAAGRAVGRGGGAEPERPSSVHARPGELKVDNFRANNFGLPRKGANAPPPKVAFGGPAKPPAAAPAPAAAAAPSKFAKAGKEAVGAKAKAVGRVAGAASGRDDRAGVGGRGGRAASPVVVNRRDSAGGAGGLNGFAKLQAAVAKGGPVIVTYDDDVDSAPGAGGRQQQLKGALKKGSRLSGAGRMTGGSELNGESEYFPVGGSNSGRDGINNDELDRLLVQARKVRAAF